MSITGSEQWMYNAGGEFYPTTIDNSLRFENTATSNLNRNHTANRKTFTMSFWMKRDELSRNMAVIETRVSSQSLGNYAGVRIETDNALSLFDYSGGYVFRLKYSAALRDVSAWYHVVLRFDTTQSVATNRIRLYINGEQKTFDTHTSQPAQNASIQFGNGDVHRIGKYSDSTSLNYSGYMADWYIIDGQSLGPTSFGELKSGIWIPKEYSGSYGTGGFHLEFDGNANDSSGNSNNWTANGVSSYDYMPTSPTNIFATFNPLDRNSTSITSLEGNLRVSANSSSYLSMRGSMMYPQSGKWYMEFRNDKAHVHGQAGGGWGLQSVREMWATNFGNYSTHSGVYQTQSYNSAIFRRGGSDHFYGLGTIPSIAYGNAGDIFQIAVDCDSGKVWFGKNNSWMGGSSGAVNASSGNPSTGANPVDTLTDAMIEEGIVPMVQFADQTGTKTYRFNAGQDSTFQGARTAGGNADANGYGDFAYAPPTDFLAMCSANMPQLAIDPANDDTSADYFNTVLYSGTGATQTISGVGFQPDLVWIKGRNYAEAHNVIDSVRGDNLRLRTNTTDSETAATVALASDGFTVGTQTETNSSGKNLVAWNWKAGGTAASNTDGSITSSVSANTEAGFSIVEYTGTAANATIGHGLGVAPSMIIQKNTIDTEPWWVYHSGIGAGGQLRLNGNNAVGSDGGVLWNSTAPTSTVFSVGTNNGSNGSGDACIAYCFANVEGHQKVGSYTGNGSSDGAFVHTGFRPAWVMVKCTNAAGSWLMLDATRETENPTENRLAANITNAEASDGGAYRTDFLSNGFKFRTSTDPNKSGSFIYIAIAEQPQKYSNAR